MNIYYYLKSAVALLDFQITHSQLLLRSNMTFTNIDIIFLGVFYMDIKLHFSGLKITSCSSIIMKEIEKKSGITFSDSFKVYALHSENNIYYVGALKCLIYKNEFGFNESSIKEINQPKGELLSSF